MAYTDEYNTAKELLTESGTKIILRKKIESEDDENSLRKKIEYEEYEGIGCRFGYSAEEIGTNDNIINAGDVKILCQLPEFPTEAEDYIVFGKSTYSIVTVEEVNPDDTTSILLKCQCRRAR